MKINLSFWDRMEPILLDTILCVFAPLYWLDREGSEAVPDSDEPSFLSEIDLPLDFDLADLF